jgi:phosphohistidine phosphatase
MRLYVMRHGPAEDHARSGRDADRALTASGRDRVRDVARALVKNDEAPRAIVTSPLVRAVQTAEIVEAECRLDEPVSSRRELATGGESLGLVKEIFASGKKRTMVVGHEPELSALVWELTGVRVEMQKAMVACVTLAADGTGSRGELRFVLDPKSLAFR